MKNKFQNVFYVEYAKIASGTGNTSLISCGGMQLRALLLPSNFSTSSISFNDSPDGVNLYSIKDFDGTPIVIPNVTSGKLPMVPGIFDSSPYIQIITNTQPSDVLIGLVLMPLYQGIHN